MWAQNILLAVIGLSAGVIVASGLFSFVIELGVVSDFADRTHTGEHILLYEDSVALGGILANIFWVFHISIPGGNILAAVFGILGGIFVGCWAMALAEMLNVFPIFIRRMKIIKSVPYLILGIAVGKTVGALLFFANHWGQQYCRGILERILCRSKAGTNRKKCSLTGKSCGKRKERNMDKQKQQEAYKNYVKQKTPVHNLPLNMLKAFITGGIICTIGQGILNYCRHLGIEKDISAGWTSMILILLSVLITGFNIYPQIAKWGGAGALVPITGFANSVAAPAIEYQKEGQVMGIGCKIFTIAGPVILYGIFSSWVLGVGYWILKILKVV